MYLHSPFVFQILILLSLPPEAIYLLSAEKLRGFGVLLHLVRLVLAEGGQGEVLRLKFLLELPNFPLILMSRKGNRLMLISGAQI